MPRLAFDHLRSLTVGTSRRLAQRLNRRAAPSAPTHTSEVALALFVVFLWATSWVLIKIGLREIPALTFAGVRYALAALALMGALLASRGTTALRSIPASGWRKLALLGILLYAVTQGAVFLALSTLPAVSVNLVWSFSTIIVAVMGVAWLSESPTPLQWSGVLLAAAGAVIYFYPPAFTGGQRFGLLVALVGIMANAGASILGRQVNRSEVWPPLVVTAVSMAIGAAVLVSIGIAAEGIPAISGRGWAILLWLAIVNTAWAFTLWNRTLRTLTAVESSVINATMLIWIPILAWLFLGETFGPTAVAGLILAGAGTVLVQLRRAIRPSYPTPNGTAASQAEGRGPSTPEMTSARDDPGGGELP